MSVESRYSFSFPALGETSEARAWWQASLELLRLFMASNPDDIVAVTGPEELTPENLLHAYHKGVFPWPLGRGVQVVPWHCPEKRFVVPLESVHIGKKTRKLSRQMKGQWKFTMDCDFDRVIDFCAEPPHDSLRLCQDRVWGTWITKELRKGFKTLHAQGLAHSVEVWEGDELIAGLYGVVTGRIFGGESMFTSRTGASKVAFALLTHQLRRWGFRLIDCQQETDHMKAFGGEHWPRERFMEIVNSQGPNQSPETWEFDDDLAEGILSGQT